MSEDTLPQPDLVSLDVAAERMGIHLGTAYRLRREDKFPIRVIKVGGQYRVHRAELDAFIQGTAA